MRLGFWARSRGIPVIADHTSGRGENMHGRRRQTPEEAAARREAALPRVKALRALQADVVRRRRDRVHTAESMAVAGRLLEINPDVAIAWNFRRECIRSPGGSGRDDANTDAASSAAAREGRAGVASAGDDAAGVIGSPPDDAEATTADPTRSTSYVPPLEDELALTEKTLRKNPKGYGSWHHRRWTVERLAATDAKEATLRREMALISQMLDVDDRNFHCWNYRRFVVSLMDGGRAIDEAELEYTTRKIELNFSNYSAWHSRTKVLPKVSDLSKEALDREYELVQQAFFTEPEDQSGWIYHRWLTAQTLMGARDDRGDEAGAMETLRREARLCRELSEMEPLSKWPVVTRAGLERATGTESGRIEAGEAFARLASLDPMRVGYYCDCCARR